MAEQPQAERVAAPGPKLQWFGLVDSELVALLEPAAARLSSLLPFGAIAGVSLLATCALCPPLTSHASVAKIRVLLTRPIVDPFHLNAPTDQNCLPVHDCYLQALKADVFHVQGWVMRRDNGNSQARRHRPWPCC